jgi:hypothetical protein
MPTIEVTEEQIFPRLDQVAPAGRRAVLQKLIGGLDRLDLLLERNRTKLESVCQAQGIWRNSRAPIEGRSSFLIGGRSCRGTSQRGSQDS